jgi:hypothetical protein
MKLALIIVAIVIILSSVNISCQDIQKGMTTDELILSHTWGKPKDSMAVRGTKYEIWYYVQGYIDTIVFVNDGKVVGSKKYSPSDSIWGTVKQWVLYTERDHVYRRNIDEQIDNIIDQRLVIGMPQLDVRFSFGEPRDRKTYLSKYGNREEWLYRITPYQVTRLVFTNGVLTEIANN